MVLRKEQKWKREGSRISVAPLVSTPVRGRDIAANKRRERRRLIAPQRQMAISWAVRGKGRTKFGLFARAQEERYLYCRLRDCRFARRRDKAPHRGTMRQKGSRPLAQTARNVTRFHAHPRRQCTQAQARTHVQRRNLQLYCRNIAYFSRMLQRHCIDPQYNSHYVTTIFRKHCKNIII